MSVFTTAWTQLVAVGNALVTSNYYDAFYPGSPSAAIPNAQKRVLTLDAIREDDESDSVENPWTGEYSFVVMMHEPKSGEDQLIGDTTNPGLGILVDVTRETLAVNLKNFSPIDHFELGEVRYGFRQSHPTRAATFQVSLRGYVNPINRDGGASASNIVVPELQAQALGDLSDVTETSPADNEVLAYDAASTSWINQTATEAGLALSGHTHLLNDLSDADDSDRAPGRFLVWNGTSYKADHDITVTQDAGGACFNLPMLSSDPPNAGPGDFWIVDTGGGVQIRYKRSDNGQLLKLTFTVV